MNQRAGLIILAIAAPAGKTVADLAQPPDLAAKGAAAAAKNQMQAQIEALAAAEGAVEAMMEMGKIDIAAVEAARRG